jgi:hypothetical protein
LANKSDPAFVGFAFTVVIASVGALWKIRTLKPDTYDRHQERVALAISAIEESAIDLLLGLGSKYSAQPPFIVGRTLDFREIETEAAELQRLVRTRRQILKRFRRMLRSCVLLQVGVVGAAIGGALLLVAKVTSNLSRQLLSPKPGFALVVAGTILAGLFYSVLLYYESRMADAIFEVSVE